MKCRENRRGIDKLEEGTEERDYNRDIGRVEERGNSEMVGGGIKG